MNESLTGPWLERAGGLDAEVSEGGSNFSFGEKQIICLCRLVLSQPKVGGYSLEEGDSVRVTLSLDRSHR